MYLLFFCSVVLVGYLGDSFYCLSSCKSDRSNIKFQVQFLFSSFIQYTLAEGLAM